MGSSSHQRLATQPASSSRKGGQRAAARSRSDAMALDRACTVSEHGRAGHAVRRASDGLQADCHSPSSQLRGRALQPKRCDRCSARAGCRPVRLSTSSMRASTPTLSSCTGFAWRPASRPWRRQTTPNGCRCAGSATSGRGSAPRTPSATAARPETAPLQREQRQRLRPARGVAHARASIGRRVRGGARAWRGGPQSAAPAISTL
jgi:hypothetical protein